MSKLLAILALCICFAGPASARPRHTRKAASITIISPHPHTWAEVLAFIQRDARRELEYARKAAEDMDNCVEFGPPFTDPTGYLGPYLLSPPSIQWEDF